MAETPRYHVIRDDREKEGKGWIFAETQKCSGTTEERIPTGDYTIRGYETEIIIERKGDVNEFRANLFQEYDRFCRELWRMRTFSKAYVVLEFEYADIVEYPQSSGLPDHVLQKFEVTGRQFETRFLAIKEKFPYVEFVFAGKYGKRWAGSVFRRIMERDLSLSPV